MKCIYNEVCTEEVLLELQSVDAQREGYVTRIEWYRDRYLGLAKTFVVKSDDDKNLGYAVIVGTNPDVYEIIKNGYISGDYSLSPRAYMAARDRTKNLYMVVSVVDDDFTAEKELIEPMKNMVAGSTVVCIVNDYKFVSQFQINQSSRTMSEVTDAVELMIG